MDEKITEYISLQNIAGAAGYSGKIFVRNTDGEETAMFMLDGDELISDDDALRREPLMVFLSDTDRGFRDERISPKLLTITQTIRYKSDDADTVAECLQVWQDRAISTGVLQDVDEDYIILKSAFPLRSGTDLPSEQVFSMAVKDFRKETGLLLEMITERLTGGRQS